MKYDFISLITNYSQGRLTEEALQRALSTMTDEDLTEISDTLSSVHRIVGEILFTRNK